MKRLSERLENIIDMIRPAEVLVDIGCDHGFVCIRAVSEGRCRRAVAADVAEGPLEIARRNIASVGLSDRIECVLSDGFRGLEPRMWGGCGEGPVAADRHGSAASGEDAAYLSEGISSTASLPVCVVITGMGGRLIGKILKGAVEKGIRLELFAELIIGAQSEQGFLRHYLLDELGVCIREERCVLDDGRYYMLMDVVPKGVSGAEEKSVVTYVDGISGRREVYSEAEYLYGKYIRPADMRVYMDYLETLKGRFGSALEAVRVAATDSTGNLARIKELEYELGLIEGRLADVR